MARLDAFDADAEAKPADGEFAEVEQSVRGSKGHAVVAANVGRQTALLEKPLKYRESVVFSRRGKRFTGEQETASVVGDRQRITVLTISQQELAFVIGAPELIGPLAQR